MLVLGAAWQLGRPAREHRGRAQPGPVGRTGNFRNVFDRRAVSLMKVVKLLTGRAIPTFAG